jgi:hypothetical protein
MIRKEIEEAKEKKEEKPSNIDKTSFISEKK